MQQDDSSFGKRISSEILSFRFVLVVALFITGVFYDYSMGHLVDSFESVPVPDLLLSQLPVVDLLMLEKYGFIFLMGAVFLYPFAVGRDIERTFLHVALLIFVRNTFLPLTHLGLPPEAISDWQHTIFSDVTFTQDLFFSGHASFPFLAYLIHRGKSVVMSTVFLLGSAVMAVTVLLMHTHYSIDVFAAYFIAFGTFHMGENLLRRLRNGSVRQAA